MRRAATLLALFSLAAGPRLAAASPDAPAAPSPGASSAAAPALPPVLRLDEALRLLRERGFDLLVAEAAVEGAEGDVSAAGAVANPSASFSYGRSFTYGHCTDALGNPTSCGVLPDVLLGGSLSDQGAVFDAITGKRGLRVKAARSALAAARASRDDALRTLTAQTKQAFVQAVVAKQALQVARDVARSSTRTAELTRTRYEAGAISEADVARIDVAKLEADQAVDTAEQNLRDAKLSLAFLLGVRGPAPSFEVEGPELLSAREPAALAGASAEALLARARERRPDLAAALRQRERAEASLALARRHRFPDVSISVNYAQQGTTANAISPPTVTAGLSFPLPIFYQQQGEIRRAEADLRTQSLQAEKLEAQVASDVQTGFSDYTGASSLARRMETALLERARRARELVSIQYQKGAASLLDFLDAQRTFNATNAEYLQDLALFWGAVFKLEQAVGEELR
jgi:cobalt-zinc-cadmium efflux system outer membrane protein